MRPFRPGPMIFGLLFTFATIITAVAAPLTASTTLYLPVVVGPRGSAPPAGGGNLLVNAPYFAVADVDDRFSELAIFWFGAVTPSQNYADVRLGYNDTELYVYVAIFDRRLWYDTTPEPADLTNWDAVTLYLDTSNGTSLSSSSHRFVAQFSGAGGRQYQAAYRASGSTWTLANVAFTTRPGWRGEWMNDETDDRGWAMSFRVPFSSLGLSGRPTDGARWRMALVVHDRDDRAGTPIPDQSWPPAANLQAPSTWGTLRFGLPGYTPPTVAAPQPITIRHGLNGAIVPDVGVGGGAVCGDGLDFWSEWGVSTRDAGRSDFNVQNQSDIADWPCFAKYFVTFPLNGLPPGQAIVSAKLVLHQFGNSDPSQARPSLIQALTVGTDWDERTTNWNNAPLATENVGAGWVDPLPTFSGWPGVRREIDVTRAVAEAYAAGTPLRLALYSADSAYHSGKHFVSSDTGDWNAVARPTLLVTVGTPVR
ncbi:MAG: DNRLRE domain-containing protein [Chloroflexaceae bacterium]